jgi:serine/threonine protein kinase
MASSDDAPQTVEDFLKAVLRSGLLERRQLKDAVRALSAEQRQDLQAVADHLVRTGKLSRYQARKLLRGVALGLVLGPFQVLAPIGRGGMGTVYLARDGRNGQLVALKVLRPDHARKEERMLARFRREMELSQRVAHPHLAWTYEVGRWQNVHYIAMEYVPGKTLSRLVLKEGPLSVARAARLFAEVATALEHAHGQGLVHRDMKPSNIMVTPHNHAKVLDLGLAMIQGERSAEISVLGGEGYIVGSMDYISPEQTADPTKVDRRADIYSLGCTLYFALAGYPPFPGGSNRDKIHKHRTQLPPSLLMVRPDLPPDFVRIVERMMAKNPDRRFPTAAAVEVALRLWAPDNPDEPMDTPDDPAFAEAVARLEADSSPLEMGSSEGGRSSPLFRPAPEGDDIWRSSHDRFFWGVTAAAVVIGLSLLVGLILLLLQLWR